MIPNKKLSPQFLEELGKHLDIDASKYNNILEVVQSKGRSILPPNQRVIANPAQDSTAPSQNLVSIDGYVLPADAMTVFVYVLCAELSKNKKINSILKTFKFKFLDVNGNQIYPNVKSRKQ